MVHFKNQWLSLLLLFNQHGYYSVAAFVLPTASARCQAQSTLYGNKRSSGSPGGTSGSKSEPQGGGGRSHSLVDPTISISNSISISISIFAARRQLLHRMVLLVGAAFTSNLLADPQALAAAADTTSDTPVNNNNNIEDLRKTYRMKSGLQLRNVRVGSGRLVTELRGGGGGGSTTTSDSTPNSNQDSSLSDDTPDPQTNKPTVVLHVQALLRDGSILMDTRQDGRPILYELGSSVLDPTLLSRSPGLLLPPGVDDTIVSRGTTVSGDRIEPMREGGIRLVVVPSELAYGYGGVSRYQAWKLGENRLRQPVPRDEILRYEIEVLRCLEVPMEIPSSRRKEEGKSSVSTITAQACCPEEVYPCSSAAKDV